MYHSNWRFLKPCKWLMDADACLQIIHYVNMWNIAFWQRGGDGRAGNAFAWHAKRRRQILSTVYAHTLRANCVGTAISYLFIFIWGCSFFPYLCKRVIYLSWPIKRKTELCKMKLGHEGMLWYWRLLLYYSPARSSQSVRKIHKRHSRQSERYYKMLNVQRRGLPWSIDSTPVVRSDLLPIGHMPEI